MPQTKEPRDIATIEREMEPVANSIREFQARTEGDNPLTSEEEARYDEMLAQFEPLKEELDRANARRDHERNRRESAERAGQWLDEFNTPRSPLIPMSQPDLRHRGQLSREDRTEGLAAWIRHRAGRELNNEQRTLAERCGFILSSNEAELQLVRDYRVARCLWANEVQFRAQSTTVDSEGGYTVPEEMVRQLEIALLDFSGVRQVADVMRTTGGGPMPWPTINDTDNMGAIVDENAINAEEAMVFGQIMFGAFKFSSLMVLLSQELIEDNAVNLVSQLGRLLGERIGRKQNEQFTVGDGSTGPQGIINAPEGVAAASGTAITGDELIDLVHSVDPAYRDSGRASFQLHDTTLAAVRKLKDSQGAYLWQPGLANGLPAQILGYAYKVNNHMPVIAISAKVVVFGDYSKYKIRDVASFRFRRLVERYAEYDQEAFIAFQRSDGKILDAGTGPLKHLVMAGA